jgi:hypothetical protein
MRHLILLFIGLFILKYSAHAQSINRLYYSVGLAANPPGLSVTRGLNCQFFDRFICGLFMFKEKEYSGYSKSATGPTLIGGISKTHSDKLYNVDLGFSPLIGLSTKDFKDVNIVFSLGPSWTKHTYYSNFTYYNEYASNSNQIYKSTYDSREEVVLGLMSRFEINIAISKILALNFGCYSNFNAFKINYGLMFGFNLGMVRNNKFCSYGKQKK